MFSILFENKGLTTTILLAWLPVVVITLLHLFKRKDVNTTFKIIWLIVGLIPLLGLLVYGVVNFKQKKSILLLTLAAIVVSALAVWYFIIYEGENNRRDPSKEQGIVITPQSIIQEFQTNEEAANKKYLNKTVEIAGQVYKTEANENGTTVFLKTSSDETSISCRLKENQTVADSSIITVKGILTGFVLGTVQLTETVVTKGAVTNTSVHPKKDTSISITKKIEDTVKKQITKDTSLNKLVTKNYKSVKGEIKFSSSTTEEDIEANNTQIISSISSNGNIQMAALIKGFRFENEVMQNHFNEEKYMNSDKFPKSEFKGSIVDFNKIDIAKNGEYNVTAKGNLTLHGITKSVTTNGTIAIKNKQLILKGSFKIHVQDYGVDGSDVAEKIDINVNCVYE